MLTGDSQGPAFTDGIDNHPYRVCFWISPIRLELFKAQAPGFLKRVGACAEFLECF
jgi:hypothetical protein